MTVEVVPVRRIRIGTDLIRSVPQLLTQLCGRQGRIVGDHVRHDPGNQRGGGRGAAEAPGVGRCRVAVRAGAVRRGDSLTASAAGRYDVQLRAELAVGRSLLLVADAAVPAGADRDGVGIRGGVADFVLVRAVLTR